MRERKRERAAIYISIERQTCANLTDWPPLAMNIAGIVLSIHTRSHAHILTHTCTHACDSDADADAKVQLTLRLCNCILGVCVCGVVNMCYARHYAWVEICTRSVVVWLCGSIGKNRTGLWPKHTHESMCLCVCACVWVGALTIFVVTSLLHSLCGLLHSVCTRLKAQHKYLNTGPHKMLQRTVFFVGLP